MDALGLKTEEGELEGMVNEVDVDGSGSIEFTEFLTLMSRKMKASDTEEEMRKAFTLFDKNGDGFISPAELRVVMANVDENIDDEEVYGMIRIADLDGDGQISYDEFVKITTSTK